MKTQKIIYAIMAVTLFFATSCSKDSISEQGPAANETNSETTFLENLESESSSKSNIIFPDSETVENQEYIDFLAGDWKVVQFTIPKSRESKRIPMNSIMHLENFSNDQMIRLEDCDGDTINTFNVFFIARDLTKISSGVRGVFDANEHIGFITRFGGCNLDQLAVGSAFGHGLNPSKTGFEKKKNKDIAISIKNNLLVIGDFSKNEIIVFKKVK